MPWPVSLTRRCRPVPTRPIQTSTRPPRGVNFTAFERRFQTTCCRRSGSPSTIAVRRLRHQLRAGSPWPPPRNGPPPSPPRPPRTRSVQPLGQTKLARHHPRVVQQVLDEPRLRLDAPLDGRHPTLPGGFVDPSIAEEVDPSHHGAQGPSQLVRKRGHELVLDPVRLLGAHPRLAVPWPAASHGPSPRSSACVLSSMARRMLSRPLS